MGSAFSHDPARALAARATSASNSPITKVRANTGGSRYDRERMERAMKSGQVFQIHVQRARQFLESTNAPILAPGMQWFSAMESEEV